MVLHCSHNMSLLYDVYAMQYFCCDSVSFEWSQYGYIALIFSVCVSEKSEKPKFSFSPDATPFVPKSFQATNVTTSEDTKSASTLSVEAREFYPRNFVPEVSVALSQCLFVLRRLFCFSASRFVNVILQIQDSRIYKSSLEKSLANIAPVSHFFCGHSPTHV